MEVIEKIIPYAETYPLSRLGNPAKLLFIDIETTGFSREKNQIYLIGCGAPEGKNFKVTQFFAEKGDESRILEAFLHFVQPYQRIIHFNGRSFDLPFIRARAGRYRLKDTLPPDTDIYQSVKTLKRFLKLPGLKQKDIESFLGIRREDEQSGGALIRTYLDFLKDHDPEKRRLLLLHNADDVVGMPEILPILFYPDFMEGDFTFKKAQTVRPEGKRHPSVPSVEAIWTGSVRVPVPVHAVIAPGKNKNGTGEEHPVSPISGTVLLQENEVRLLLPLYKGELKHFYPDYRNYYYFEKEDCAVHKSVAAYMDASGRKKATARTCYTRASGLFLPEPDPIFTPVMQKEYHSPLLFAPWKEDLFASPELSSAYVQKTLRLLL